jgi:acetyltransferase-like isoleucine patch superfamily enzyme
MVLNLIKKLFSFFNSKKKKRTLNIHPSVLKYKNVVLDTEFGGSITIGEKSELQYGVILMTYGGNILIGKNCSINPYTVLYGHGNLTIGDNVLIAGHCLIIPANHNFSNIDVPITYQGETKKGIVIENNVWIGSGCRILDGVTIGEGSIVAAGAVVNRNVEPFTIVGGVPAKNIRKRN